MSSPEGQKFFSLYTGSFNLSNNTVNSEMQVKMHLKENSWIAYATDYSIKEAVKKEPQFALTAMRGTIRNSLAKLFGINSTEVPLEIAASIEADALNSNLKELVKKLIAVSKIETHLTLKLDAAKKRARLDKLVEYLKWYFTNAPPKDTLFENRIRKFLTISNIIADEGVSAYKKNAFVESTVWSMNADKTSLNNLIVGGASKLSTATSETEHREAFSFDWDDTIMKMPTKIILFHKLNPNEVIEISTSEFAEARSNIGQSGKWKNYEIRKDGT